MLLYRGYTVDLLILLLIIIEIAMYHVSEFSRTSGSVDFDEGAG